MIRKPMPSHVPKPPPAYESFVKRYAKLGQAWESIHQAGEEGPLDPATARLVRLGIAIGAMREGAIHSSVRKALALGIGREEIEQVVALAAGTLGLPSTVAVYTWVLPQLSNSGSTRQLKAAAKPKAARNRRSPSSA
jgi:alkylhydroperoxidase/carboxymuconolactone decarboxylase family protein YurZ